MTGTALTEADEFSEIYGLGVVEIPRTGPVARKDEHDAGLPHRAREYEAIVKAIRESHERGPADPGGHDQHREVEMLAEPLKKDGIPHNVLNAREHAREAQIVARPGQPGASPSPPTWRARHRHPAGRQRRDEGARGAGADPEAHPDEVRAGIEAEHAADKER
jgi:preprotein translocase subunit SecA